MQIGLVAILLSLIVSVYTNFVGGYEEYHPMTRDESDIYGEVGEVDKLSQSFPYIHLFEDPVKIMVKRQIVNGINFVFQVQTGNPKTPELYMKVFRGPFVNPELKITSFGTHEPS